MTNQSELDELDRLIIENQSEDGSIDISDQRSMRDEIVAYITANYTTNSEVERLLREARIDEAKQAQLLVCEYSEVDDNIELLRANRDLLERVAQLSKLKEEKR